MQTVFSADELDFKRKRTFLIVAQARHQQRQQLLRFIKHFWCGYCGTYLTNICAPSLAIEREMRVRSRERCSLPEKALKCANQSVIVFTLIRFPAWENLDSLISLTLSANLRLHLSNPDPQTSYPNAPRTPPGTLSSLSRKEEKWIRFYF